MLAESSSLFLSFVRNENDRSAAAVISVRAGRPSGFVANAAARMPCNLIDWTLYSGEFAELSTGAGCRPDFRLVICHFPIAKVMTGEQGRADPASWVAFQDDRGTYNRDCLD